MNDDGRCNGYTTAMTAMERGGDSNDTHTSNGRHRGMLARYGRASVHLELSSFGYKYGAPPHRSQDGSTYACPLLPLDVRDLDCAPGHVSKFNGLLYLAGQAVPPDPSGGHANNDRRRDCGSHCNEDDCDDDEGEGGR